MSWNLAMSVSVCGKSSRQEAVLVIAWNGVCQISIGVVSFMYIVRLGILSSTNMTIYVTMTSPDVFHNVMHISSRLSFYRYNSRCTSSAIAKLLVKPGLSIPNKLTKDPPNPSSFTI